MSDPPAVLARLRGLALPVALALAWALAPVLLLPLVPGVLLLAAPIARRLDRVVLWIQVGAVSLAFWMLSFWLLAWLPLPLVGSFHAVSLAAVVALAILRVREQETLARAAPAETAILALFFLVVPALRLLPMASAVVAAGADMSMHTYVTALIARADGVPATYRPLLDIGTFGGFPVGFPTLAALVTRLADLPPHRAAFVLAGLSHALLTPALYAVARARASRGAALLAALTFSFAVLMPQRFVVWGGNPTVLGIAFAALFWASLADFRRWDRWDLWLAATSLAAVLAVHTIVFVQLCYLAGLPLAVLQLRRAGDDRSGLWRGAALLGAAALLAAPYLAAIDPGLASPEAKTFIRKFVLEAGGAWQGTLADAPWSIPGWWIGENGDRLWAFLPVVGLGAWWLRPRDPEALALHLASFAIAFVMVANIKLWWLPLSFLIYSERTVAMLGAPLALLGACGLDAALTLWRARGAWDRRVRWSVAVAAPAAAAFLAAVALTGFERQYYERYVEDSVELAAVTGADLEALRWLAAHGEPGDAVRTNYGDAGTWVPGIAGLRATDLHVNVAFLPFRTAPEHPRFALVGERCIYGPCRLTREVLRTEGSWLLRYESGDAAVFERAERPPAP